MQSLPNLNLEMDRTLKGKLIKGMGKGEWAKGKESALWLAAGGRACGPPTFARRRWRPSFIPRSEMRGRVGDRVCSVRAQRAEAGPFRSGD